MTREAVVSLPLDSSTPINIIIHGYTESSIRPWVANLTDGKQYQDQAAKMYRYCIGFYSAIVILSTVLLFTIILMYSVLEEDSYGT